MDNRIFIRSLPILQVLLLFTLTEKCSGESITECYGGYYTGLQCTWPSTITIKGGLFGVSRCRGSTCCPDQSDCTVTMTESNTHLQYIKDKCNGKQRCASDARPERGDTREKCGDFSDYVTVNYDCLIDGSTTSSTLPATSPIGSTANSNTTGIVPTSSPPGQQGLSAGAIVGIVFGVILFILLLLFIIFAILVRRKNPNWPQTHNWKEPFRDYRSYVPDRVTSVMHRITRRKQAPITSPNSKYDSDGQVPDITIGNGGNFSHTNYQPTSVPSSLQPHLQQGNPHYHHPNVEPQNTLSTGVEIVRTPQEAIDSSDVTRVDSAALPPVDGEEPLYEVIDDFSRGNSVRSLKRCDSYDSFDSMEMENTPDRRMSRKTNKMTINDAIYYGAVESNQGTTLQVENSLYEKSKRNTGHAVPETISESQAAGEANQAVALQVNSSEENPASVSPKPTASPKFGHSGSPKTTDKPPPKSPKPGKKPASATYTKPWMKTDKMNVKPDHKPLPASSKPGSSALPGIPKTLRPSDKAAANLPGGLPSTQDGTEAGQVYENTDFDGDTYYNAGGTPDEKYYKLDPATTTLATSGGDKNQAYTSLHTEPTSSSC